MRHSAGVRLAIILSDRPNAFHMLVSLKLGRNVRQQRGRKYRRREKYAYKKTIRCANSTIGDKTGWVKFTRKPNKK